jgi:hypothetical protein
MDFEKELDFFVDGALKEAQEFGLNDMQTREFIELIYSFLLRESDEYTQAYIFLQKCSFTPKSWQDITSINSFFLKLKKLIFSKDVEFDYFLYDKIMMSVMEDIRLKSNLSGADIGLEYSSLEKSLDDIESMHYSQKEKIDAKSYVLTMKTDSLEIKKFTTSIESLFKVCQSKKAIDLEYIQTYKSNLIYLIDFFKKSEEFNDLSEGLKKLIVFLSNDAESINQDDLPMLKIGLDSIVYDIKTWDEQVLRDQTTSDIHYLDAALFANIDQISAIFEQGDKKSDESEDDEDDFELF